MGEPKRYKRSWKNLLLNRSYQLRFTMFMVVICAVLMSALGFWVMDQARTATTVAINNVEGQDCYPPAPRAAATTPTRVVVETISDMEPDRTESADGADKSADGADKSADGADKSADGDDKSADGDEATSSSPDEGAVSGEEDRARPRPTVTIETSEIDERPVVDDDAAVALSPAEREQQERRYQRCKDAKAMQIEELRDGETFILQVLIGVGILLLIGLAFYGIKMTHKVAGPLYKVSLYLDKVRDEKYDTVYDLRKGDHLVDFYDKFKAAHAGLRSMQEADVEQLKSILAAVDKANIKDSSPELSQAVDELQAILERKEGSLG